MSNSENSNNLFSVSVRIEPLPGARNDQEFLLHEAALEWGLSEPIVIRGESDIKAKVNWKDRLEPSLGVDDMFGRLWSLAFSILTLFAFYRLAREYLSRFYAAIAFAFFAFAPLIFDASTSVQPEGLTISAYIAGVYFFVRWLRNDKLRDLFFAAILISTTLLAKATAAHVGLLFAILLYEKFGYAAIKNIRLWLFGAISVIPAAVWYIYAKSIWNTYGNSLGVSNEYHWIGSDFFTNPYFITGILRNEIVYVWAIFGIVAAAFGVIHGFRERTARFALAWFASIFVFLLVAARTTADDWASYYHIYATAPAALLFAFGFERLWKFARNSAPGGGDLGNDLDPGAHHHHQTVRFEYCAAIRSGPGRCPGCIEDVGFVRQQRLEREGCVASAGRRSGYLCA